jgi:hypothetical protein
MHGNTFQPMIKPVPRKADEPFLRRRISPVNAILDQFQA